MDGGIGGGAGGGIGGGGGTVEPPACLDDYPGTIFCDGFEDPDLAGWTPAPAPRSSNGWAERVTDRVRSGSGALRAYTTVIGEGHRGYAISDELEITGPDVYFRAFFYVEGSSILSSASYMLLRQSGAQDYGTGLEVANGAANLRLQTAESAITTKLGAVTVPKGRWTCLEGHVAMDETSGTAEYFVDGALAVTIADHDTIPTDGYDSLAVGVARAGANQEPLAVWVDDVVVATERIGCD
jgi:hypothetical protein